MVFFQKSNKNDMLSSDRVLVVLFGWAGSQERHLKKYEALVKAEVGNILGLDVPNDHISNGIPGASDSGVVVLSSCLPVKYIFSPIDWPRRSWTNGKIMKEILDGMRHGGDTIDYNTKLILYAFSNGGGFVIEQLYRLMAEGGQYEGVRKCIKGIIFDSAPGYMSSVMSERVLRQVIGEKSRMARIGVKIANAFQSALAHAVNPRRAETYWRVMQDIDWCPILYLYSEDDHLCDADMLFRLILDKINRGHSVERVSWDVSAHCGHYALHPEEYRSALRNFLYEILSGRTSKSLSGNSMVMSKL
jgi:pimeloyl-ACP methyl ester carboxylesterase